MNFDVVLEANYPYLGWRKFARDTAIIPGVDVSQVSYKWDADGYCSKKDIGRQTKIGFLKTDRYPPKGSQNATVEGFRMENVKTVLFREMTYHPDCGEVFYPKDGTPFVAVLAPAGDDFNPAKVRAYYFDGTFGLQCNPNIWHQGMYALAEECVFQGKQGPLHACITVDTVWEFGYYLSISLEKPTK